MTILPKGKKSHSLAKAERYSSVRGGGHSSPNSSGNPASNTAGHESHHRYASANSNGSATGVDVTSGAMISQPFLANVANLSPAHQLLNIPSTKKQSSRKHSAGTALTISNQSQGQVPPSVGPGSSLLISSSGGMNSPQSPSANPTGIPSLQTVGKGTEKSLPVAASSSKRKPGSTSKNRQTHHQQNAENCNSDDEYGSGFKDDELEIRFAERLKKARGLVIKEVKGDGACMFRAVADQIYGDEEMHVDVRTLCMDYIAKNRDHFSQFLTEDFDIYLTRKREMETHGNHVELQAISEIFSRPIEIFEYSIDPINTFHPISPEANTGIENPPIRLSYHGTVHYNSVIDPFTATIGVGLGLPEFKPGMADRNLMKEASIASEAQHIEEAMLNDKLRMTDWERTEEELSKQIAKDSYMDYLRQLEGKEPTKDSISFSVDYAKSRPTSPTSFTSPLSVSTKVAEEERQLNSSSSGRFGQRSTTTNANSSRLSSSSGTLGSKRGASSPNIPCCSRDDKDRISGYSPMAKVHKNDASSSMPNIGPNFGQSFSSQTINDHMRPSTSASSLQRSYGDEPCASSESQSRLSSNAPATSSGLYEELLASSALAYDDDWGSSATALDEAAMLARVMAVSQAEFYDTLKKSPK